MNTIDFIEKAKEIHGDKYDYSKTVYINGSTKVCIICPEHGEFWQMPYKHLQRQGCSKCSKKYNYTTDEWVQEAEKIHFDKKYDYSKVNYINNHTKVCIICPKHGEFNIRPNDMLNGQGCKLCGIEKNKIEKVSNTNIFIEKAKKVHGDKYDYSKVKYINNHTKVCIICPKHGEFWQIPNSHLNGSGCKLCGIEARRKQRASSLNDFVEKSKIIHNNKYDYSKVKYINTDTKVCIICPEHGEFWQTPHGHLQGQGCSKCYRSVLEENVAIILKEKNINYTQQKTFSWLKNKNKLRLDFYLPDYNIAIECQGRQHFEIVESFGGVEGIKYIQNNDKIKKILCEKNNLKLYYITYKENVDEKISKILNDIKNVQDSI